MSCSWTMPHHPLFLLGASCCFRAQSLQQNALVVSCRSSGCKCGFLFWRWSSCFYCNPLVLWWQIAVHMTGVPIPPIAQMVCPISEHVQDLVWTTPLGSSFEMYRAWAFHQNHLSALVGSSIQSLHFPEAFILWHRCLRLTANGSNFGLFLRSAAYLQLFS